MTIYSSLYLIHLNIKQSIFSGFDHSKQAITDQLTETCDITVYYDDLNMTFYNDSNKNIGVQDYEIVDFYDRNTTVSVFFEIHYLKSQTNKGESLVSLRHRNSIEISHTSSRILKVILVLHFDNFSTV